MGLVWQGFAVLHSQTQMAGPASGRRRPQQWTVRQARRALTLLHAHLQRPSRHKEALADEVVLACACAVWCGVSFGGGSVEGSGAAAATSLNNALGPGQASLASMLRPCPVCCGAGQAPMPRHGAAQPTVCWRPHAGKPLRRLVARSVQPGVVRPVMQACRRIASVAAGADGPDQASISDGAMASPARRQVRVAETTSGRRSKINEREGRAGGGPFAEKRHSAHSACKNSLPRAGMPASAPCAGWLCCDSSELAPHNRLGPGRTAEQSPRLDHRRAADRWKPEATGRGHPPLSPHVQLAPGLAAERVHKRLAQLQQHLRTAGPWGWFSMRMAGVRPGRNAAHAALDAQRRQQGRKPWRPWRQTSQASPACLAG